MKKKLASHGTACITVFVSETDGKGCNIQRNPERQEVLDVAMKKKIMRVARQDKNERRESMVAAGPSVCVCCGEVKQYNLEIVVS